MDWQTPTTFSVGQIVKPAEMNQISDNLRALKGMSGTVSLDEGVTASGVITATAGMETEARISGNVARIAGVATEAGVVSSARISGASHITTSGRGTFGAGVVSATHISTAGNVSIISGALVDGVDVRAHDQWYGLMHGVSKSMGGSNPGRVMSVNFGTYVGTGGSDNPINHSLGAVPYQLRIQSTASSYTAIQMLFTLSDRMWYQNAAETYYKKIKSPDMSSFYVGCSGFSSDTDLDQTMNLSGRTYHWAAIG